MIRFSFAALGIKFCMMEKNSTKQLTKEKMERERSCSKKRLQKLDYEHIYRPTNLSYADTTLLRPLQYKARIVRFKRCILPCPRSCSTRRAAGW